MRKGSTMGPGCRVEGCWRLIGCDSAVCTEQERV